MRVLGTLRGGVGADTERGPGPLDGTCSVCDTGLTVAYEDGLLSVECANNHRFPQDWLPPGAVTGRELSGAVRLQARRTQHHLDLVREGVCPGCFDNVDREHTTPDEPRRARRR